MIQRRLEGRLDQAADFTGCIEIKVFDLLGLQAVADIIRTTLGPRSMLKMLLDANGGEHEHPSMRI